MARGARIVVVVEVEEKAALPDDADTQHERIERETQLEGESALRGAGEPIRDDVRVDPAVAVDVDHLVPDTGTSGDARFWKEGHDRSARRATGFRQARPLGQVGDDASIWFEDVVGPVGSPRMNCFDELLFGLPFLGHGLSLFDDSMREKPFFSSESSAFDST